MKKYRIFIDTCKHIDCDTATEALQIAADNNNRVIAYEYVIDRYQRIALSDIKTESIIAAETKTYVYHNDSEIAEATAAATANGWNVLAATNDIQVFTKGSAMVVTVKEPLLDKTIESFK